MCVFFSLSSAAYISVCPLSSGCEGVSLQKNDTSYPCCHTWVCACVRVCVSLRQGVQPQGGSAEARQWQACLKYLGQTMLRAGGCSFTDSWIIWPSTRSQALTCASDKHTHTHIYLLLWLCLITLQSCRQMLRFSEVDRKAMFYSDWRCVSSLSIYLSVYLSEQ